MTKEQILDILARVDAEEEEPLPPEIADCPPFSQIYNGLETGDIDRTLYPHVAGCEYCQGIARAYFRRHGVSEHWSRRLREEGPQCPFAPAAGLVHEE